VPQRRAPWEPSDRREDAPPSRARRALPRRLVADRSWALLLCVLGLAAAPAPARAQAAYVPSAVNLAAREWFQDAKFGMFIHWGVYSLLQDDAWVMNTRRLHLPEYETLAAQFNPTRFDPAAWVDLAKAAGARYITVTTKHHDGFAMFDTQASDWDIMDRTPYRRDVIRALADECRR